MGRWLLMVFDIQFRDYIYCKHEAGYTQNNSKVKYKVYDKSESNKGIQ